VVWTGVVVVVVVFVFVFVVVATAAAFVVVLLWSSSLPICPRAGTTIFALSKLKVKDVKLKRTRTALYRYDHKLGVYSGVWDRIAASPSCSSCSISTIWLMIYCLQF
jgi:hypothetical protein